MLQTLLECGRPQLFSTSAHCVGNATAKLRGVSIWKLWSPNFSSKPLRSEDIGEVFKVSLKLQCILRETRCIRLGWACVGCAWMSQMSYSGVKHVDFVALYVEAVVVADSVAALAVVSAESAAAFGFAFAESTAASAESAAALAVAFAELPATLAGRLTESAAALTAALAALALEMWRGA